MERSTIAETIHGLADDLVPAAHAAAQRLIGVLTALAVIALLLVGALHPASAASPAFEASLAASAEPALGVSASHSHAPSVCRLQLGLLATAHSSCTTALWLEPHHSPI